MKRNKITPILIIGAARNGTTFLENIVASLPQVAGVEHWLHYGSHESNICRNKLFWGDLRDVNDYITFLYHYSSFDYFKLCKGDIDFHLKNKQDNFYNFFFDLMDNYCHQEKKAYWTTKLDPKFFIEPNERRLFLSLLKKRYDKIKIIRIQRDFKNSFKSYLKMEGVNHKRRQKQINLWPSLFLQASRYVLTYSKKTNIEKFDILDIDFENFINDKTKYVNVICEYLDFADVELNAINLNRFQINTSFVKQDENTIRNRFLSKASKVENLLKKNIWLAKFSWRSYEMLRRNSVPDFRRLIKYNYYRSEFIKELEKSNAYGILNEINKSK